MKKQFTIGKDPDGYLVVLDKDYILCYCAGDEDAKRILEALEHRARWVDQGKRAEKARKNHKAKDAR